MLPLDRRQNSASWQEADSAWLQVDAFFLPGGSSCLLAGGRACLPLGNTSCLCHEKKLLATGHACERFAPG